jgi:hypothetical protein
VFVAPFLTRLANGEELVAAARSLPYVFGMAVVACGILTGLAYLSARTTLYTLTSKRLLLKIGVALPAYVNLPLKHIDSAAFAETGSGCGTICFRTAGETRLAYLLLWPHAKPWHFRRPQPALRDIPHADQVANKIAQALGGTRMDAVNETPQNMVPAE